MRSIKTLEIVAESGVFLALGAQCDPLPALFTAFARFHDEFHVIPPFVQFVKRHYVQFPRLFRGC
jgi:hypothetical protein